MRVDLTERVALVTGGAHRIGKAIALELAKRGSDILIHYSSSGDAATETLREIKSLGVNAHSVQADLRTQAGVETVFTALREHFGELHILVNSAANFQQREILDVTLEEWQETMAINLTAPFLCTQAAATLMRENDPPGGVIINILDKGALEPWPKYAHHSISKAGLWMLTQVSAASLGPNIRVNAVIPGPVLKPAGRNMSDEEWAKVGQGNPLQRTGTPEDVARAVAYLASEDFISGAAIPVNGGEHMW